MLIDSCVLIDFFRGENGALEVVENGGEIKTSVINWMEIVVGLPGKENQNKLSKLAESINLEIVMVDEQMSKLALEILVLYRQKLGLDVADALVAATAIVRSEILITRNQKHFKGIKGLRLGTY